MKMSTKWVITLQKDQSQCCVKLGAVDEICLLMKIMKITLVVVIEISL